MVPENTICRYQMYPLNSNVSVHFHLKSFVFSLVLMPVSTRLQGELNKLNKMAQFE